MKPGVLAYLTFGYFLSIALWVSIEQAHSQQSTNAVCGENPEAKRFQQKALDDYQTGENAEYTRIFTELGLKPEDQQRFESRLTDILHKAVAAGDALRNSNVLAGSALHDLDSARMDYDRAIREALGEEKYLRYRIYEDFKPAIREYKLLQDFAAKSNNFVINLTFRDEIVELIRASEAITTESWAGPYGVPPHPEVGMEMCLRWASHQAVLLRQAASNLVQILPKSGLPADHQCLLRDYLSSKIAEAEHDIARFSVSKEEFVQRMLQQAEKEYQELMLKRRSNATNIVL